MKSVSRPRSAPCRGRAQDTGISAKRRPRSVKLRHVSSRQYARPFEPKVGDSVIVRGYFQSTRRGNYQLMVDHMEASGDGALQRALEALKQKLQSEGLFDQDRKKAISPHCEQLSRYVSDRRCGRRHHQRTRSQIALKPHRNLPRSGPRCWLG